MVKRTAAVAALSALMGLGGVAWGQAATQPAGAEVGGAGTGVVVKATREGKDLAATDARVTQAMREVHSDGGAITQEDADYLSRYYFRQAELGSGQELKLTYPKPWAVYAGVSNTAPGWANDWESYFGFTAYDLTGVGDSLDAGYQTWNFDELHAAWAEYERPVAKGLRVGLRGYWGRMVRGWWVEPWDTEMFTIEGTVAWNVYQSGPCFVDVVGGVEYRGLTVDEGLLVVEQYELGFVSPWVGLRLDRRTAEATTSGALQVQSVNAVGNDEGLIMGWGRDADRNLAIASGHVSQSAYLEWLVGGVRPGSDGFERMQHEVYGVVWGRWTMERATSPATWTASAGGAGSVRGYAEGAIGGDDLIGATAEYRYHVARLFSPSNPGRQMGRYEPGPVRVVGRSWDLLARVFVDAAHVSDNSWWFGAGSESLVSAGWGVGFALKDNVTVDLDWGFALKEGGGSTPGDGRLHLAVRVLY